MLGLLKRTDPTERLGGELLTIIEGLLNCRSMSEYHCLTGQLENFDGFDELDHTRFGGLANIAGDLVAGLGEFCDVMQQLDTEAAMLTGRTPKVPWSRRDD